jgi:hypothetical protein
LEKNSHLNADPARENLLPPANYISYFNNYFKVVSRKMNLPLRIQIEIQGLDQTLVLSKENFGIQAGPQISPDLILEIPSEALHPVMQGRYGIGQLFYSFQFKVKTTKDLGKLALVHKWF